MTLAEYRRFDEAYVTRRKELWKRQVRSDDSPALGMSWYQAAAYCNWLSKQEGVPESEWCYEPVQESGAVPSGYKEGMKMARNYLQRKGYRLPTEAEIEYATRAGAVTAHYYGETEELLEKYAWYNKNAREQTWPVGSTKPNDLGMFDTQGNVFTWCQDRFDSHRQNTGNGMSEDNEDAVLAVASADQRVLRGGTSTMLRPSCAPHTVT